MVECSLHQSLTVYTFMVSICPTKKISSSTTICWEVLWTVMWSRLRLSCLWIPEEHSEYSCMLTGLLRLQASQHVFFGVSCSENMLHWIGDDILTVMPLQVHARSSQSPRQMPFAAVIKFLQPNFNPADAQILDDFHSAVVQSLRNESSIDESLSALMPSVKELCLSSPRQTLNKQSEPTEWYGSCI